MWLLLLAAAAAHGQLLFSIDANSVPCYETTVEQRLSPCEDVTSDYKARKCGLDGVNSRPRTVLRLPRLRLRNNQSLNYELDSVGDSDECRATLQSESYAGQRLGVQLLNSGGAVLSARTVHLCLLDGRGGANYTQCNVSQGVTAHAHGELISTDTDGYALACAWLALDNGQLLEADRPAAYQTVVAQRSTGLVLRVTLYAADDAELVATMAYNDTALPRCAVLTPAEAAATGSVAGTCFALSCCAFCCLFCYKGTKKAASLRRRGGETPSKKPAAAEKPLLDKKPPQVARRPGGDGKARATNNVVQTLKIRRMFERV